MVIGPGWWKRCPSDQRVFFARLGYPLLGARAHHLGSGPIFLLEDICCALVAGEEVRSVLGLDEALQRVHSGKQPHEVVLSAQRKHGVDQIVSDTGLALLHLQAVGEKVHELVDCAVEPVGRCSIAHLSRPIGERPAQGL